MAIRPLVALTMSTLFLAGPAYADPPRAASATDELRRNLDEVIVKIQSPEFRALETARRREQIRKITDRLFNWSEMAKRALGDHWGGRTATERRAFADWFAAIAERAYAGSVDNLGARGVPANAVLYLGETTSGTDTLVRTALAYPRELPIDFLMTRRAGRWEVCDLRVDGVSAAENYRAQFQRIIGSTSFPTLVERMNTKRGGAASP
jgi:ABC-type transporter MlaC component